MGIKLPVTPIVMEEPVAQCEHIYRRAGEGGSTIATGQFDRLYVCGVRLHRAGFRTRKSEWTPFFTDVGTDRQVRAITSGHGTRAIAGFC